MSEKPLSQQIIDHKSAEKPKDHTIAHNILLNKEQNQNSRESSPEARKRSNSKKNIRLLSSKKVPSFPNPVTSNHATIRITSMHRPNSPSRIIEKRRTAHPSTTMTRVVNTVVEDSAQNRKTYLSQPVSTTTSNVHLPVSHTTYSTHTNEPNPSIVTQYVEKCLNCQSERIVQNSNSKTTYCDCGFSNERHVHSSGFNGSNTTQSHTGGIITGSSLYSPNQARVTRVSVGRSPYQTEYSSNIVNTRRVHHVQNTSSNNYRTGQETMVYSGLNRGSSQERGERTVSSSRKRDLRIMTNDASIYESKERVHFDVDEAVNKIMRSLRE